MFDNIGSKIKGFAKLVCLVGVMASIIAMISFWITGGGASGISGGFSIFIFGLLTGALGCLAAWVGALLTYGFGQLLEDSEAIRHDMEDLQYCADELRRMGEERRRGYGLKMHQPEDAA